MTRTALVIGCGGTIGGAWSVAALHHLAEQTGWNPASAAILQGTSAGAEIVTMFGGGRSVDDLVAMHEGTSGDEVLAAHLEACPSSLPPVPVPAVPRLRTLTRSGGHRRLVGIAPRGRGDAGWLQRLADASTGGDGWFDRDGIRLVAYRPSDDRRIAFGASDAPGATVGQALRASWGIPGWMPPVEIGGESYVDGGAASTASLDLIGPDDAELIYVVAPMASLTDQRAPGPGGIVERALLRAPMSATLRREVDRARARGTRVVVVTPGSDDLAGLGANFMRRGRRRAAFDASMRTAAATVRRALDEGAVA